MAPLFNFPSDGLPIRQSMPIPVSFHGFYSDTMELGRHGWELAMADSYDDMYGGKRTHIILHHHKLAFSMYGMLHGARDLHRRRLEELHFGSFRGADDDHRRHYDDARYMGKQYIDIRAAGSKGHVYLQGELPAMSWRSLEPQTTMALTQRELHTLPLFAEIPGQELIVDPQDVSSLLEHIMQVQRPAQRDIRARNDQRERRETQARQVHARVVSLAA